MIANATRTTRIAWMATLALSVVIAFIPLLGAAGPESALVLALALASFYARAGVDLAHEAREQVTTPLDIALRGARIVLVGFAIALVTLTLNGLRVGACTPGLGATWLALGVLPSWWLAITAGVIVGALIRRRRIARSVAAVLPWLEALYAVWRFYDSPAVFSYGHFFGFFSGTLYDEDVQLTFTFVAFRVLTMLLIVALIALLHGLLRSTAETRPRLARPFAATIGALAIVAFIACTSRSESFGFTSSAQSLQTRLGQRVRGRRCDVVLPSEVPAERAHLYANDCDFRIEQHEQALHTRQRARVTAFFFRSASEKREAMGAAHVYIAKPWRNEVYLQLDDWPNPILAHELAHVVSGAVANNPFHIAWSGWVPNPGLIEGIAVALAWTQPDEMDPHEWTRTLIALDRAPRLQDVLGTRFLLAPANRAYTVAGSFVRFLLDAYGAEVVKKLYQSGDVQIASGKDLQTLEREWKAFLAQTPVSQDSLALAQARFERGGIFERACPHLVAALKERQAEADRSRDFDRAMATCNEILRVDPADASQHALRAVLFAEQDDITRAQAEIDAMKTRWRVPSPTLASAQERVADALWVRGESDAARSRYDAVSNVPRARDAARTLSVKRWALTQDAATQRALAEVLARRGERNAAVTMNAIAQLDRARTDGLGAYLEARQLMRADRNDLVRDRIHEALRRGLPLPALEGEAHRVAMMAAFIDGDLQDAQRELDAYAAFAVRSGERMDVSDWRARIAYAMSRR